MKLNRFNKQLVIGILLSTNLNPVESKNWLQVLVGSTFKLGAGTVNAFGSLVTAGLGLLDPIFDTMDIISEEAFKTVNPWQNRTRASQREFTQKEELPNGFGDAWDLLINHGGALEGEGLLNSPFEEDDKQLQRVEVAKVINDKINELNSKFDKNNTNSYPKGVFEKVQQVMDTLYSPGFNAKDPDAMGLIDELMFQITQAYNKALLDGYNLDLQNPSSVQNGKSKMEQFDNLIFFLEDRNTNDSSVINEYVQSFCNKYYKSPDGEFYYEIDGIMYSMTNFILSPDFDFYNDESIIQLVRFIREIEEIYFNLPENKGSVSRRRRRRRSAPLNPQEDEQQQDQNLEKNISKAESTVTISPEAELTIGSLSTMSDPLSLIELYCKSYYQNPGTKEYYDVLKLTINNIAELVKSNQDQLSNPELLNELRVAFNKLESIYWLHLQNGSILSASKLGPGFNIYNKLGSTPTVPGLGYADLKQETKGFITYLFMGRYPMGKTFTNIIYDYLQTHYANNVGEFDQPLIPIIDQIKQWANNPSSNPQDKKSIGSLIKLFIKLETEFFKKNDKNAGESFTIEQKHSNSGRRNIFGVTVDFVQGLIECLV